MRQRKSGSLSRLHQSLLAAGLGVLMAAGMSVSPVFAATTAKETTAKVVPAKTEHAKEMPAKTTTTKTAHEQKVPAKEATAKTASK